MAKARSTGPARTKATDSTSGELEPRRSTSTARGVRRGTARRPSESSIGLPDERVVCETDETVPIKPMKGAKRKEGPTVDAAIDRRKQFTGTNEHANDRRK